ncbi:MAG: restriction endonuclease [Candidatus Aegiribacteria sp.]|nr:restriction endonuclease [Candidatus Aegiribacteria sp.]
MRTHTLVEYERFELDRAALSEDAVLGLWSTHSRRLDLQFPSPRTEDKWQITSKGWVGFIPFGADMLLEIRPKVSVRKLFKMIDIAYNLSNWEFSTLDGSVEVGEIKEMFEGLAGMLARRILQRSRRGLYRTYVDRKETLPYVRGRLDIRSMIRRPWEVKMECEFQEHTADVEDNQIILWTLFCILRAGMCSDRFLTAVRHAYRTMLSVCSLESFTGNDCRGRQYTRLNNDYAQMHGLCGFFLDSIGPEMALGTRQMPPFLVDMAALFEKCVANWMKKEIENKTNLRVDTQSRVRRGPVTWRIDLVLYDVYGNSVAVLDTKYKWPDSGKPSNDDINQVVAYAELKGCGEAILIYPVKLEKPVDIMIGDIHVRSLTFDLDNDLDLAGNEFLRDLFSELDERFGMTAMAGFQESLMQEQVSM